LQVITTIEKCFFSIDATLICSANISLSSPKDVALFGVVFPLGWCCIVHFLAVFTCQHDGRPSTPEQNRNAPHGENLTCRPQSGGARSAFTISPVPNCQINTVPSSLDTETSNSCDGQ